MSPAPLLTTTRRLGRAVRMFRGHLEDTEHRMRTELGADIDVKDWKELDPRQHDPGTCLAEPDSTPVVRRRSDGHLEMVTTDASSNGPSEEVAAQVAARAPCVR